MPAPCNNYTQIVQSEDICQGTRTNAACVVDESLYSELGLSENATQQQINQAQYLAAINQKATTDDLDVRTTVLESTVNTLDGSETKIEAGNNINVTGIGTIASPYVIAVAVPTETPTYKVLLSQTGVNNPTPTVLKNTIGDNLIFTRIGQGFYLVEQENIINPLLFNVILKQDKAAYVKTDYEGSPIFCFYIQKINDYSFYLSVEMNDMLVDSLLSNIYMEFEVYN